METSVQTFFSIWSSNRMTWSFNKHVIQSYMRYASNWLVQIYVSKSYLSIAVLQWNVAESEWYLSFNKKHSIS